MSPCFSAATKTKSKYMIFPSLAITSGDVWYKIGGKPQNVSGEPILLLKHVDVISVQQF